MAWWSLMRAAMLFASERPRPARPPEGEEGPAAAEPPQPPPPLEALDCSDDSARLGVDEGAPDVTTIPPVEEGLAVDVVARRLVNAPLLLERCWGISRGENSAPTEEAELLALRVPALAMSGTGDARIGVGACPVADAAAAARACTVGSKDLRSATAAAVVRSRYVSMLILAADGLGDGGPSQDPTPSR